MYGAFLGDIIGSPFEFDRGNKTKEFDLFTKGCEFTDDSVMTVAVAEALLNAGKDADADTIKRELVTSMQKWGHKYPNAGYGCRFSGWLRAKNPKPYNSCGNGSAMRVSAAGWLYDSLERTREVAALTAVVTHNHPEGIKAAEATAAAIFMARNGASKEEIKDYVVREFHYDLSRTCDEIRPGYYHIELAQKTVPEAITAFLESESFEDAIRTVVSLGGDTDTLAAITGSIAEAFYGIPALLVVEAQKRLPEDMMEVVNRFHDALSADDGNVDSQADYAKNEVIKMASLYFQVAANKRDEAAMKQFTDYLAEELIRRMLDEGGCPMPFVDKSGFVAQLNPEDVLIGQTVTVEEPMRLVMDTMQDGKGKIWLPLFTDEAEMEKGQTANVIMWFPILEVVKEAIRRDDLEGIVINPFEYPLTLPKTFLQSVMEAYEYMAKQKTEVG